MKQQILNAKNTKDTKDTKTILKYQRCSAALAFTKNGLVPFVFEVSGYLLTLADQATIAGWPFVDAHGMING